MKLQVGAKVFSKRFLLINVWGSLLATVLLLCLAIAQQPQSSKQDFGELEKVALAELAETNTPGAAVGVVSGDRLVFAKGFGVSKQRVGPDTVIGFVAETVVGATAGCVPPAPGYFERIREICDRYGVLLILDEVMCGLGRTGARWACAQEGVAPDLLVVAKGLGAGYQPISATLVADKIFAAIRDARVTFMHGHSYQAHAVACAAALAVQRVIREQNLIANSQTQGESLKRLLNERFGDYPDVGDIRGRGLCIALELVKDRETKEPFDPAMNLWLTVMLKGMEFGLMCYPGGGTAGGEKGDHVLLAPPFNINSAHVEEIVEKLSLTFNSVFNHV